MALCAAALCVCLGVAGCGPQRKQKLIVARPATPQPFCTRTLGLAECFADPGSLPDRPAPLGDMPQRLQPPPLPWWDIF
jgi:hypothetical protein